MKETARSVYWVVQFFLIFSRDLRVDHLVSVDEGQIRPPLEPFLHGQVQDARMVGPHVVGVGQAEVLVEAMLHGKEFLEVAQVPLSVAGGGVALLFADLRNRHFVRIDSHRLILDQGLP